MNRTITRKARLYVRLSTLDGLHSTMQLQPGDTDFRNQVVPKAMRRSALLIHRSPIRSKLLAAVTAPPCQHLRDFAADSEAGDNSHASKSSWVPEWLQKRLPGSCLP